jgi:hypothetical protein
MSQAIPDDVRRFVLTSIPSVPHLEAALLLRGHPGQALGVAEVAARLYVPERSAAELLKTLCASGIAHCTDGPTPQYRYSPKDAALADVMDRLAQVYAQNLVGVTTLIHDATQRSAQRFSDAFRLRKDK